jgi:deoxyribodipyrimidine photo-lyase
MMNIRTLETRTRLLNDKPIGPGPIVYWMNRDQRLRDNWALFFAADMALKAGRDIKVVFVMFERFGSLSFDENDPIYVRLGQGLNRVMEDARSLGIDLTIEKGDPVTVISTLMKRWKAGALIGDYSPLKPIRKSSKPRKSHPLRFF